MLGHQLDAGVPGYPTSADRRTNIRSKKDLYVLDLPAAVRSSATSHVSQPRKAQSLSGLSQHAWPSGHASKSLHSRCQSARRTLNTERRNWFTRSQRPNAGIQHCSWNGGARRDRTDDLKLAKLPLSQLSYGPVSPTYTRSKIPRTQPQSGGPGKTRTSDLTLIKRAL